MTYLVVGDVTVDEGLAPLLLRGEGAQLREELVPAPASSKARFNRQGLFNGI